MRNFEGVESNSRRNYHLIHPLLIFTEEIYFHFLLSSQFARSVSFLMAVPVFNLAPDLTVSRLCLGSTLFLCSCLLQSLVVFEFLILKFRILARNHDFRRAKHAATILSSPRSSFQCRNQLVWLRWNVPSGSASRDSGEERRVSWPLDKGEQHSSRRRRFGHQGCSIGLFTLLVSNSFQYIQLAFEFLFVSIVCYRWLDHLGRWLG